MERISRSSGVGNKSRRANVKGKDNNAVSDSSLDRASAGNATIKSSFKDSLVLDTSVDPVSIFSSDGTLDESMLSRLQDAIHHAGDKLLEKPGIDTVLQYKRAVQQLLTSVVPYLHEKEHIVAPKRFGNSVRERKFMLVHQINKKLDHLLQLVLNSQANQMSIMNAMDTIKGLIIDILQ